MTSEQVLDELYPLYLNAGRFSNKPPKLERHFTFASSGLTSLSSLVFILSIEERFHIDINLEQFIHFHTIGELVDYILAQIAV